MYSTIINPINGKIVKTSSKQGQLIIEKYKKEYNKKNGGGLINMKAIGSTISWSHDMLYNLTPYGRFGITGEKLPCIIANQVKNYHHFGYEDHKLSAMPTLPQKLCQEFTHSDGPTGPRIGQYHIPINIWIKRIKSETEQKIVGDATYDYEYEPTSGGQSSLAVKQKEYHKLLETHSKEAFHKNWKMVQRYKQLLTGEPEYKTRHITEFFGDKTAHNTIRMYFTKLYTPLKNPEYESFKAYFNRIARFTGNSTGHGSLRFKYYNLMEQAEYLSFQIYLNSVIPRNCRHSGGINKSTMPEPFEKSHKYTLNDDIKDKPHNFLRMYFDLFSEHNFFDNYIKYWDRKITEYKEYEKKNASQSMFTGIRLSTEEKKLKKMAPQIKIYTNLKKKFIGGKIYEIYDEMPFSEENIRDMEKIFYKTGLFYNEKNKENKQITRFDERVWKLFWSLGHQHGMYDIFVDSQVSATDEAGMDLPKKSFISAEGIYNLVMNTSKVITASVTTPLTMGFGAVSDIAKRAIDINSSNISDITTALLSTPLGGDKNPTEFKVGDDVQTRTGEIGVVISTNIYEDVDDSDSDDDDSDIRDIRNNRTMTEQSVRANIAQLRIKAKRADTYFSGLGSLAVNIFPKKNDEIRSDPVKYIKDCKEGFKEVEPKLFGKNDVIKIIDEDKIMKYYEVAHFAGYYYALADNFYTRVTRNKSSRATCKDFRKLSIKLNVT